MLRIWRMSGQELPAVSMEEISDVRDLKASLCSLHGFPMCMQQLQHIGNSLDDCTKLDAPMELQLVLLACSMEVQQREAVNEFFKACKEGNLETTRLLLEAGANKDARTVNGYTALMLAVEIGRVEITRMLLEAGADKDLQSSTRYTALMLAVRYGHVETARLLLEAGADKELQHDDGYTALMLTVGTSQVEIARLLLEAGAGKDGRSYNDGYTALMLAAETGQVEIARLLMEAGADKDLHTCSGKTALILAEREGHGQVATLLRANSWDHTDKARLVGLLVTPTAHSLVWLFHTSRCSYT